jgi:hypothetical protein
MNGHLVRQARSPHDRWARAVLGVGLAALVTCHAAILGYKKFADVDEGYASAIAERLLEGFKLYSGAVSQRGPLMYYGFAAMMRITGWDNVMGIRCWALAFCLAHVVLVFWAGRRLVSLEAGVVAALATVYGLGFGFPARDAVALQGEAMQLPPLIVSAVLGALAMRHAPGSRGRVGRLAWAGLALGISISIKQSVALHLLPVAAWIVADAVWRRGRVGPVLVEMGAFVGSTLFVPAVFVLHALREGTLREMVYYCLTYNLTTHLHPTSRWTATLGQLFDRINERAGFFLALVFVLGWGVALLAGRLREARRNGGAGDAAAALRSAAGAFGPRAYLGLHLIVALATGASMSRFFPHYFLPAMPFLTILLGAAVDVAFRRHATAGAARIVAATLSGFLLLYAGLAAYFLEKIDGRIAHEPLVERLARYLEASTSADQRIFVWGFSPWLYAYSHRRPAGRYVFETYVTGFVPWFWEDVDVERQRIVPGSVDALLDDLDREKPEVVVDAGAVLFGRGMRGYEEPMAWLKHFYCFELRFGAFDVYRRKREGGEPCEVPDVPKMHFAVDFYGSAAPYAAMPVTLDFASSRWLPPGDYDSPIVFPEQLLPPLADALRDRKVERERAEALKKLGVTSSHDLLPPAPCAH